MTTILKAFNAKINGKNVTVQQATSNPKKQDIFYLLNGRQVNADKFWGLKPVILS